MFSPRDFFSFQHYDAGVKLKTKSFDTKARDKLLQLYCLDTLTGPIYSAFGHFS